jgi:hypothetical protein
MTADIYQITVKGYIDMSWSQWFGGWAIDHANDGNSVLTSPPIDQAALHGVLRKLNDLNLALISVQRN